MKSSLLQNNNVTARNQVIENTYFSTKFNVNVTPCDGTITSTQLIEVFKKKYGNRAEIEAFLRNSEVNEVLDSILKGEAINVGMPVPSANNYSEMSDYLILLFNKVNNAITYSVTTTEGTQKNIMAEHSFMQYCNELPVHDGFTANKLFLLIMEPNYLYREKINEIVNNMAEDEWICFKSLLNINFNNDTVNAVEDIMRHDGATAIDVLKEQEKFDKEAINILHYALLHEKSDVIKAALKKYTTSSKDIPPEVEENYMAVYALAAMTRGNPAICEAFLSNDMWNTYDITTKACILALIIQRSGNVTQIPLLENLVNNNMINSEVLTKCHDSYYGDDKDQKLNELRIRIDTYYAEAAESPSLSNSLSRHLAGTIFLTPKDNSLSLEELAAKADAFNDNTEVVEILRLRCSIDKELGLTNAILHNDQNTDTSSQRLFISLGIAADQEAQYAVLDLFNKNHIANRKLIKIVSHAVQLDKHCSIYWNGPISLKMDPVIKLLAYGVPELLSHSNRQAAKKAASNNRAYLKQAANKMYKAEFPDLNAGELVDDILYGASKNARKILEQNTLFGSQEMVALRFAVLEGRADLVEYILKKYSNTRESGVNINNFNSDIKSKALTAVLFDDKAVCLHFLETMWGSWDDRNRADVIQHIITRTSIETKQELMGHLCENALLTPKLTAKVRALSTGVEQSKINELYSPFLTLQNEMSQCKKSARKPEEILSSKAKNEERKYALFAELSLSCKRELPTNTELNNFIQKNLSILNTKYSDININAFKKYFPSQAFIEPANELFAKIAEAALVGNLTDKKEEKGQITNTNKQKNKTTAKAPITSMQNNAMSEASSASVTKPSSHMSAILTPVTKDSAIAPQDQTIKLQSDGKTGATNSILREPLDNTTTSIRSASEPVSVEDLSNKSAELNLSNNNNIAVIGTNMIKQEEQNNNQTTNTPAPATSSIGSMFRFVKSAIGIARPQQQAVMASPQNNDEPSSTSAISKEEQSVSNAKTSSTSESKTAGSSFMSSFMNFGISNQNISKNNPLPQSNVEITDAADKKAALNNTNAVKLEQNNEQTTSSSTNAPLTSGTNASEITPLQQQDVEKLKQDVERLQKALRRLTYRRNPSAPPVSGEKFVPNAQASSSMRAPSTSVTNASAVKSQQQTANKPQNNGKLSATSHVSGEKFAPNAQAGSSMRAPSTSVATSSAVKPQQQSINQSQNNSKLSATGSVSGREQNGSHVNRYLVETDMRPTYSSIIKREATTSNISEGEPKTYNAQTSSISASANFPPLAPTTNTARSANANVTSPQQQDLKGSPTGGKAEAISSSIEEKGKIQPNETADIAAQLLRFLQDNYNATQQPQQGNSPIQPQQGYMQPQQGYMQPQQGYMQPQQGYMQPQQGYVPYQQGYVPYQQGYVPYQQGYMQPQQGYVPYQQGYMQPQQGYGQHQFRSTISYIPYPIYASSPAQMQQPLMQPHPAQTQQPVAQPKQPTAQQRESQAKEGGFVAQHNAREEAKQNKNPHEKA